MKDLLLQRVNISLHLHRAFEPAELWALSVSVDDRGMMSCSHCLCSWQRPACCWRGSHTVTQSRTSQWDVVSFWSPLPQKLFWWVLVFVFDSVFTPWFEILYQHSVFLICFECLATFWSLVEQVLFVDKTHNLVEIPLCDYPSVNTGGPVHRWLVLADGNQTRPMSAHGKEITAVIW